MKCQINTVELQVLMRVYNIKINFFPKGHIKQTSNIPFIDNLKIPECASKQDGLKLATLRYYNRLMINFSYKLKF